MSWTAPRTWVTAETVTAAIMNTHVRDNLLETVPAKAVAAGDIFYATAANTIAKLAKGTDDQVLRGGTVPAWSDQGDLMQLSHDVDNANFTMSTSFQSTLAAVVVNPGWTEFFIIAFAHANIIGGGSGNKFEVALTDGVARGTVGTCEAGSAAISGSAACTHSKSGVTTGTTFTVQVKQTDAGTAGTFDSAAMLLIAVRTG